MTARNQHRIQISSLHKGGRPHMSRIKRGSPNRVPIVTSGQLRNEPNSYYRYIIKAYINNRGRRPHQRRQLHHLCEAVSHPHPQTRRYRHRRQSERSQGRGRSSRRPRWSRRAISRDGLALGFCLGPGVAQRQGAVEDAGIRVAAEITQTLELYGFAGRQISQRRFQLAARQHF